MNDPTTQSIYTFLPASTCEIPKILSDLGRPTKRGIKKCPKCGVYNGTRGMMCKNKRCDAVLKDYADKRKVSLDAVRLAGIVRRVYSVRVRDRGPDHRGFVQLPLLPSEDKNVLSENALCFVDSCQRLFDDSILKCHEMEQNSTSLLCVHIDSAIKSQTLATPVEFKNEILSSLRLSKEIKAKLWILATEKEGPLVQRVSRTVMAVKCQVSPKHPLGYLHFTFGCTKGREVYDKYFCSCTEFMVSGIISKSNNVRLKCIHYYACICALASDPKCSEEFVHFINYELPREDNSCHNNDNPKNNIETNVCKSTSTKTVAPNLSEAVNRTKSKTHDRVSKRCYKKYKKLAPNIFPVEIKVLENREKSQTSTSWKFQDWLTYVTESINQTMQFENYGNLNTLIFCIPEVFYEEFKMRIPNTANEDFMHSYRIMNILYLKQIFDTCDVKLRISKRFVHDNERGYVEYNEDRDDESCQSNFIFFLNVGQSTVDESDNINNPFLIEWVPNLMSSTKVGQLKLQYKYGRKST